MPPVPADEQEEPAAIGRQVAAEVAAILGGIAPELLASAPLTLPLALSLPMARHRLSADELTDAMQLVRGAILQAARLDPSTEPVPLAAGGGRRAALMLAGYLHDLLFKAAHRAGAAPGALAASAAHLLSESAAPAPVGRLGP